MATRLPRHLRVLVEVLLVEIGMPGPRRQGLVLLVMEALMAELLRAQVLVFEIDVLRIFPSACPLEEGDRMAETGLDRT